MKQHKETWCLFFSEESKQKIIQTIRTLLEFNQNRYLHVLYMTNSDDDLFEKRVNQLKNKYFDRLIIKESKYNYSFLERLYSSYSINQKDTFLQFIKTYKKYTHNEKYIVIGNSIITDAFVSEIQTNNIKFIIEDDTKENQHYSIDLRKNYSKNVYVNS